MFELKSDIYPININGTDENPLFQAKQIGQILGIMNIHDTISKFDDEEKLLGFTDTHGCPHKYTEKWGIKDSN